MNFKNWLEKHLEKAKDYKAYNFNLYEEGNENEFAAQLIGCNEYSLDDEDWACDGLFSSQEDLYVFTAEDWEQALDDFIKTISDYISDSGTLPFGENVEYITVGFVDGNLEVVFQANK